MFTIDLSIKDLNPRERNITKAFFSMNNHQVATPEMMLEEARSYVFFFRENSGKISAYIGIYLLLTGRKLFYSHSSNPFSEQEIGPVEEEARNFAEGLGAMLDEVDLAKMDHREKMHWIDSQDIFSLPQEKPEAPAPVQPTMPAPQEPAAAPQTVSPPPPPQPPAQPAPQAQQPAVPAPASPAQQPAPPVQKSEQSAPALSQQPAPPSPPVMQETEPELPGPAITTSEPQQVNVRKQKAPKSAPAGKGRAVESREEHQAAAPLSTAERERLQILQTAIKAGVVKPLKPAVKKDAQSAKGVISRDREALARLLTSF